MTKVFIDDVEYVPKLVLEAEQGVVNKEQLQEALAIYTKILFFPEVKTKHREWALEAFEKLAPKFTRAAKSNPRKAYDQMHPEKLGEK